MTPNHRRNLANRCNALKSTGPKSTAGKHASSQNSRKHGLNSAPVFESSLEYQALVDLIAEEGFSASASAFAFAFAFAFACACACACACADIPSSLLNYRRVMDAYYDTYSSPEQLMSFCVM